MFQYIDFYYYYYDKSSNYKIYTTISLISVDSFDLLLSQSFFIKKNKGHDILLPQKKNTKMLELLLRYNKYNIINIMYLT